MEDAVQAARRLLEIEKVIKPTPQPGTLPNMAFVVARALLSSRPSIIEECAQRAFDQTSDDPAPGNWNDACEHIAASIRSLKEEKDG